MDLVCVILALMSEWREPDDDDLIEAEIQAVRDADKAFGTARALERISTAIMVLTVVSVAALIGVAASVSKDDLVVALAVAVVYLLLAVISTVLVNAFAHLVRLQAHAVMLGVVNG